MKCFFRATLGVFAFSAATLTFAADLGEQVEKYRMKHEAQIVSQLDDLTRIRSVAAEPAGLVAAADYLLASLKKRGFDAALLSGGNKR